MRAVIVAHMRKGEDGSLMCITRTINLQGTKATSDYFVETQFPPGVAPKASLQRTASIRSTTRSKLTEKLRELGVNLDVMDSFICKQQGSTLASLSGLALLQFIERLVGTWALAEEIEAEGKTAVKDTDAAIAFEVEEIAVCNQRRALAPARSV